MVCENTLISVKNLHIVIKKNTVVHNVSFELKKGAVLGIVGESGSGKSMICNAIMGILPERSQVAGQIIFEGNNLLDSEQKFIKLHRGTSIAMIFQQAMNSLNPSRTCGKQVLEMILKHKKLGKKQAKLQVLELFKKVKLPEPHTLYGKYPHQISGGQQQRVIIAMAISCNPQVLIADEPTTALDAVVQKEIISLLKTIQKERDMAMIFISHDLNVIAKIADNVVVLRHGKIMEQAALQKIFSAPQQNYTKALIACRPKIGKRCATLATLSDFQNQKTHVNYPSDSKKRAAIHENIYKKKPLLRISHLKKTYKPTFFWGGTSSAETAIADVSFEVYKNETLGLVGNSGCGKSTLAKILSTLEKPSAGTVFYKDKDLTKFKRRDWRILNKEIQMVFQDPQGSLNPKMKVGEAISEPMKVHRILKSNSARKEKTLELLQRVGLQKEHYHRYPKELSGGQQQRVGIARALAVQPEILICDESVAALDVSSQATILNLLNGLKRQMNLTYIFISHDLDVVYHMADRVMVLQKGRIKEINEADLLYKNPQSSYTKKLIQASNV